MKWIVRADWRPPKSASSHGKAVDRRRHRQPGQKSIGKPTTTPGRRASAGRCSAAPHRPWRTAAGRDRAPSRYGAELGARRPEMRKWRRDEAPARDEAVDANSQAKKKCQRRPIQVLFGRQRRPGRKPAPLRSPSSARDPEQAGRIERVAEHCRLAGGHVAVVVFLRRKRRGRGRQNPWPGPSSAKGCALKICRPLISRMRKQSALIQWASSHQRGVPEHDSSKLAGLRRRGRGKGRHGLRSQERTLLTIRRRAQKFRFRSAWTAHPVFRSRFPPVTAMSRENNPLLRLYLPHEQSRSNI